MEKLLDLESFISTTLQPTRYEDQYGSEHLHYYISNETGQALTIKIRDLASSVAAAYRRGARLPYTAEKGQLSLQRIFTAALPRRSEFSWPDAAVHPIMDMWEAIHAAGDTLEPSFVWDMLRMVDKPSLTATRGQRAALLDFVQAQKPPGLYFMTVLKLWDPAREAKCQAYLDACITTWQTHVPEGKCAAREFEALEDFIWRLDVGSSPDEFARGLFRTIVQRLPHDKRLLSSLKEHGARYLPSLMLVHAKPEPHVMLQLLDQRQDTWLLSEVLRHVKRLDHPGVLCSAVQASAELDAGAPEVSAALCRAVAVLSSRLQWFSDEQIAAMVPVLLRAARARTDKMRADMAALSPGEKEVQAAERKETRTREPKLDTVTLEILLCSEQPPCLSRSDSFHDIGVPDVYPSQGAAVDSDPSLDLLDRLAVRFAACLAVPPSPAQAALKAALGLRSSH